MKLIDWTLGADGPPIVNDCCTRGAASWVASPGWSALTVHVPAATKLTVGPETVQIPALDAAAEKTTARPEVADALTT